MTTPRRVLAVVPAKNEENYIERSAVSLAEQVLPSGVELRVILVDDSSEDSTYEVMKSVEQRYSSVHAVRISRRGGYSTSFGAVLAIRYGVRYAERQLGYDWDLFMYLDADSVIEPLYLAKILSVARRDDVGIAGGVIVNEPIRCCHVPGTGMTVKREVWRETGGLRPEPAPDTMLQLRALQRGWRVVQVRNARITLLRPTGIREGVERCKASGVIDGYVCSSPVYAMLRAVRLALIKLSPRCGVAYLAGFFAARSGRDASLCPLRGRIEAHRLLARLAGHGLL